MYHNVGERLDPNIIFLNQGLLVARANGPHGGSQQVEPKRWRILFR